MDFSYKAEGRVEMLKKRSKRCCCRYCGKTLELKSMMFSDFIEARIELYCPTCDRIEFGVEPEVYASAKYFAQAFQYNCYSELDNNENTQRMTIAKLCDIMAWQDKHLGIMTDDGFVIPLAIKENMLGEAVLFNDSDLQ